MVENLETKVAAFRLCRADGTLREKMKCLDALDGGVYVTALAAQKHFEAVAQDAGTPIDWVHGVAKRRSDKAEVAGIMRLRVDGGTKLLGPTGSPVTQ